jgi:microcystin degradation protein MlrC
MKDIMDRIAAMEREPGILAATIFPTQPWMDVTELAWSTVVVADGNKALAQGRADELARMAWDRREAFLVQKTPVREAVEKALASDKHPFVLADSSDSVTGGAYGDGNVLLRTLLEMGYRDRALLTLTDPEAVAACFAAGVGGEVSVALGGKLAPQFYRPVTVNGRVKTLSDGWYVRELPPGPIGIGRTAVLEIGRISVLLSERPAPTIDQEAYHSVGLEPRNAKIVQVKSPGGFRAIYGPFAAGIFELAAPGPTDSELTRLPFKKIRRPLWPFDPELTAPW